MIRYARAEIADGVCDFFGTGHVQLLDIFQLLENCGLVFLFVSALHFTHRFRFVFQSAQPIPDMRVRLLVEHDTHVRGFGNDKYLG